MSTLIVEVCKINEILQHPNADKLEIAHIKGWFCLVGKGEHKAGELVIFIPPDAVVTDEFKQKYNLNYLKNGNRIRVLKLRGFVSQGLILKLPDESWKEGQDVASELGITKWEPPVREGRYSQGTKNQVKKRQLNQNFHRYTDIENVRNYNNVFTEGEEVLLHEKVHGSNWRIAHIKKSVRPHFFWKWWDSLRIKILGEYEIIYGSHRVQLRWGKYDGQKECFYKENIYEKIAKKYGLDKNCPKDYTIFGEVYGDGVQDLTYGFKDKEIDLVVFDVKDERGYLNYDKLVEFCEQYKLPLVPLIYRGAYNDKVLAEFTSGASVLALKKNNYIQIREGVVIRPIQEENNPSVGRKILKSISEDYLTRKGDQTEFQ